MDTLIGSEWVCRFSWRCI